MLFLMRLSHRRATESQWARQTIPDLVPLPGGRRGWRWIVLYATAAVTSLLALLGRLPRWLAPLTAAIALAWLAAVAVAAAADVRRLSGSLN